MKNGMNRIIMLLHNFYVQDSCLVGEFIIHNKPYMDRVTYKTPDKFTRRVIYLNKYCPEKYIVPPVGIDANPATYSCPDVVT